MFVQTSTWRYFEPASARVAKWPLNCTSEKRKEAESQVCCAGEVHCHAVYTLRYLTRQLFPSFQPIENAFGGLPSPCSETAFSDVIFESEIQNQATQSVKALLDDFDPSNVQVGWEDDIEALLADDDSGRSCSLRSQHPEPSPGLIRLFHHRCIDGLRRTRISRAHLCSRP